MNLIDLQHLVEAHGADPERWPRDQRAAADELLARDPAARTLLEEAWAMDAAIVRTLGAQAADEDATRRVLARLASLPPQKQGLFARLLPTALIDQNFAPAWPRLAMLACGAALGFVVGISGIGDRVAGDLIVASRVVDVEPGVFDAESITGLQP